VQARVRNAFRCPSKEKINEEISPKLLSYARISHCELLKSEALKVAATIVIKAVLLQVVPRCPRCLPDEPLAIMKPDIVFFGENLPEQFHRAMKYDKNEVDLLIVIGSSLKVRPVALIPSK